MTRRRFAHETPKQASNTLADRLTAERLPLDLSLSLAVEVVEAVAAGVFCVVAFALATSF